MFAGTLLTMFVSTIALLMGMFVDGIIIGNYLTTSDMAAYGVISPVSSILLAISGIFSSGTQLVAAGHLGSGKQFEARRIFTITTCMLFIAGVVLMLLFMFYPEEISTTFGARGDLTVPGRDYFYGLSFSTPFLLLASFLVPFLQLDGNKKTAVIAVVSLTLTDIAFDLLAVKSNLGMMGIGLATSFSSIVAFIIMCTHFTRNDAVFKIYLHKLKFRETLRAFFMGIPTAAGRFFATFRTIFLNFILLATATSSAVAAFSARTNLGMICAALGMAIGMTTLTVSGVLYGEEDRTMLTRLFKTGTYYSIIINVLIMIGLLISSDFIIMFYMHSDAETCALAARALRFCAISLPLYSVNNMLTNYLQATQRLKWANLLMFLQSFLFSALFALLFIGVLGTDAVWASYIACEVLTTFIYVIAAWIRKRKITFRAEDLLMLPEHYGGSDEDKMEGNIRDMDEVMEISAQAYDFCIAHDIDEERSAAISLALKELGSNVIKFGFSDGKKHSLQYRILIKDDTVIFRLRDDCLLFDPIHNMHLIDMNSESHKGTKALYKLAKKFNYMNTMSLNNLLVIV